MPSDVTMPKLSDTMEEGKILKWLKRPGEPVAIGEIVAEVETDKANMELEAYDEGTLAEVRVQEGDSAPVGAVIAVLAAPGEGTTAQVTGTGPGGRIVQKDVEAALAARGGPLPAPAKPGARAQPPPAAERRVELSRIRRTTAKRMGESKREIPHFYASTEIAMDEA